MGCRSAFHESCSTSCPNYIKETHQTPLNNSQVGFWASCRVNFFKFSIINSASGRATLCAMADKGAAVGGVGAAPGEKVFIGDETRRDVRSHNFIAARAVADTVRTSLGPKGMDKMITSSAGDVIITNDGATILSKLEVIHPAAKMVHFCISIKHVSTDVRYFKSTRC